MNDATTLDGAFGDGGFNFGDSGGKDSGRCGVQCSGDLHDVVDCNGNVITACPQDQGCAAGTCVAACDAAKANKSSVGCDYYAVPATDFTGETCFAVYVANTWGSPVTLTASWGAQSFTSLSTFAFVPQGSGKISRTPRSRMGRFPSAASRFSSCPGRAAPKPRPRRPR